MGKNVVIENPILNSPYDVPTRHFKFTEEGITNVVVEKRRVSSYFVPIPRPRKSKDIQTYFTEWTEDRIEENAFINQIRAKVDAWRAGGRRDVTKTTARLLEYWTRPDRDRRLFFCQVEALETAIYLTEVAKKKGDSYIEQRLIEENQQCNPSLYRIAFKMATGSGKTVVMAMLIAWQALNKFANIQDARYSDAFLIVTPGITIRDRLRVLLPNDPDNYYRKMDLLPPDLQQEIVKAKVLVTNFHQFKQRERIAAGKLTKDILIKGGESPFTETPEQMVRRVCRSFGNKKNILVINDEAHHCYRRKPEEPSENDDVKLEADEKAEAEKRNEVARVWISGLEAIKEKLGIKVVYDLSATPFFLRGSGYSKITADGKRITEGLLFPWVVSDFSLIDAIEAGIVKVPRVPVSDNSMTGDMPTYRELWRRIREGLPKKGRGAQAVTGEPKLPGELEGALQSLYGNYEKYFKLWKENKEAQEKGLTPPVFIVVCNNTNVSKLVFDYIAGWEKTLTDGTKLLVPGKLDKFNNVKDGHWSSFPNTILVDSEQLESGEAMSDAFKKIATVEIEEFKREYRERFPDRDVDKLTDEDLLREVLNTVGKKDKLGEQIKCVVSVSMLTEGWDANTVTHILGVRAFGTQLLCEQVVGRALRRMSYAVNASGTFDPEYAEVYGVPFSFIPCSGSQANPKPGAIPTRVRALDDRIACLIQYPRVSGYKYDIPSEKLSASFTESSKMVLSTEDVPTKTENAPIVGQKSIHTLDELKVYRLQHVAFELAKVALDKYFRDKDENPKPWLFPQLAAICKTWLSESVICKDNTFPQLLLLVKNADNAAGKIYQAIVTADPENKTLKPILRPYDTIGSTKYVDFHTVRPTFTTVAEKCHVSHVVADTNSWEQKLAQTLEEMEEVVCYVKNDHVGFTIPYTFDGEEKNYYPDFIVKIDDGLGQNNLLNLIIEVTGEKKKDKEVKVATAKNLWIPAINNHGEFGRWEFVEVDDPWNAMKSVRKLLRGKTK